MNILPVTLMMWRCGAGGGGNQSSFTIKCCLCLSHFSSLSLSQMRKLNNSWVWIQICLEIGIKVFNFPKFKYRLAQRSGLIFKVQSFNDKMCRLGADRLKNGLILLAGIKEKQQKAEAGFSSDKLGNNQDYHIIQIITWNTV